MTRSLSAAQRLGQRLAELDEVSDELYKADMDAVELRLEADVSEAKLFLSGEGSIEKRKSEARVANKPVEFAALAAEAHVRHLTRKVRIAEKRVDVGRTYSADIRAEAAVAGRDGTP